MKSGTDITSMSAINDFYSCILKKMSLDWISLKVTGLKLKCKFSVPL